MFPRQIQENLWILGNEYFHIYLLKGTSASALVETGISATADLLLEQMSSLGVCPDFIIVTHPHSDHVTGLHDLKIAFPAAKVIAGKGADLFLQHPKAESAVIREDTHMTESLASIFSLSNRRVITSVPSLSGCAVVNDGDEIDLGSLKIRFLEAKGHSPGNILVHIPEIKTLLVSDSLGNHYPEHGFFPTFFTGFSDYMNTIERLVSFEPAMLGLAHNGLFTDKKEIMEIFLKATDEAKGVRDHIFNDWREDEVIAGDLFRRYYHDELAIYSPENIMNCCHLLVRRIRECLPNKK